MGRAVLRLLLVATLIASIGGAGYLLIATPPPPPVTVEDETGAIVRGYVGTLWFAHWRLICASDAPQSVRPAPMNQCRVNYEAADRAHPGQIIVAVNMMPVGPAQRPAVMFRLPPTARDGDEILLTADGIVRARAVARGCTGAECLAVGAMSEADWKSVLAARTLQVTFLAVNRQRVLVDIPVDGLGEAARAMSEAQTKIR